MNAVVLLGLAASVMFLTIKSNRVEGSLKTLVREYEGETGVKPSEPRPPHGASYREIKDAWALNDQFKKEDYEQKLSVADKTALEQGEHRLVTEERVYDAKDVAGPIEGYFLELVGHV